ERYVRKIRENSLSIQLSPFCEIIRAMFVCTEILKPQAAKSLRLVTKGVNTGLSTNLFPVIKSTKKGFFPLFPLPPYK
ncbi:MAG: hypothetical protein AB1861_18285, partial [Cyanobacteriota bacterium]